MYTPQYHSQNAEIDKQKGQHRRPFLFMSAHHFSCQQ
jgi:hypothetical protein